MSSFKNRELPYRPGVGMMIIDQQNRIFVGKRIDTRMTEEQLKKLTKEADKKGITLNQQIRNMIDEL